MPRIYKCIALVVNGAAGTPFSICLYTCGALYEDGEKPMDVLTWIAQNSELILMLLSMVLAVIARYFGAKAALLAAAMQSLVDLQQEFLNDIRDGVISQQELSQILAKIQAASQSIKDVLNAFIQPVPTTQKIAIIFGGGDLKSKVSEVHAQATSMKTARMGRR